MSKGDAAHYVAQARRYALDCDDGCARSGIECLADALDTLLGRELPEIEGPDQNSPAARRAMEKLEAMVPPNRAGTTAHRLNICDEHNKEIGYCPVPYCQHNERCYLYDTCGDIEVRKKKPGFFSRLFGGPDAR